MLGIRLTVIGVFPTHAIQSKWDDNKCYRWL